MMAQQRTSQEEMALYTRLQVVSRALIEGDSLLAGIFAESELRVEAGKVTQIHLKWSASRLWPLASPEAAGQLLTRSLCRIGIRCVVIVTEVE